MTAKRPIHRIACVGEVMIELIAGAGNDAFLGVAGDTYNTAVYLARACRDADVTVSFVTALGQDAYSDRILSELQRHGVDDSYIERRANLIPGLYAIDTDEHGERSFTYWRSASAARSLFSEPCDIGLEQLEDFDMVFLSGITMAILPPAVRDSFANWAKGFSARGGTLVYDSNHRTQLWEDVDTARAVNQTMWKVADISLPSVDDEMALFGEDEEQVLARLGHRKGALKRGAGGPLNLSDHGVVDGVSPVEKVVDSTAAGDSFNAGYLAAVARGHRPVEAARAGHVLAAKVIQHRGAIIPEDA